MYTYRAKTRFCPVLDTQYIQNPRVPVPNIWARPCVPLPGPVPTPAPPVTLTFLPGDLPLVDLDGLAAPRSLLFVNNQWIAVGTDSNMDTNIYTSSNGSNWSAHSAFGSSNDQQQGGSALAYNGSNLYVAVGTNGTAASSNSIYTSVDGSNWTARDAFYPGGNGNDVLYDGTQWVAAGQAPTGTSNAVYTSPDGSTWAGHTAFELEGQASAIAYNGSNLYVAVGQGSSTGSNLYISTDASNWSSPQAVFGAGEGVGICYIGNQWIAVGQGSNSDTNLYTSPTGTTWTPHTVPGSILLADVAYNGSNLYVTVGEGVGGGLWTSPNGSNWSNYPLFGSVTGVGYTVKYSGGLWIAAGQNATTDENIYTSSDGSNWTPHSAFGVGGTGSSIAYGNGTWVVFGQGSNGAANVYYATT
jgi:hypothetical protein